MSAVLSAATDATRVGRLPAVRGRLTAHAPIGRHTWLGSAARLKPPDRADLAAFLASLPAAVPVTGGGANVLVRDGGVAGVVIRLGRGFAGLAVQDGAVAAGAGRCI